MPNKNIFFSVLLTLGMVVFVYLVYSYQQTNYQLGNTRKDDVYLTVGDKVIIPPTIIESNKVDGYFYGIRLPVKYLKCNYKTGGFHYKMQVQNTAVYFILNLKHQSLIEYINRSEFEVGLQKMLGANLEKLT